jgi:hypothetical protein
VSAHHNIQYMLLGDEWKRQQQGGMILIPELHKNTTMKNKSEACTLIERAYLFNDEEPFQGKATMGESKQIYST